MNKILRKFSGLETRVEKKDGKNIDFVESVGNNTFLNTSSELLKSQNKDNVPSEVLKFFHRSNYEDIMLN